MDSHFFLAIPMKIRLLVQVSEPWSVVCGGGDLMKFFFTQIGMEKNRRFNSIGTFNLFSLTKENRARSSIHCAVDCGLLAVGLLFFE